jgi:LysR family glycine cleavage system transcriptional activator
MRTPPLPLLRTFEAAARHGSFKAAAAELHVTPAAVSQQVRALEEHLGVELFRREVRRVELTDRGREFLRGVGDGLQRLAAATLQVKEPHLAGALRVTTVASFALHWLVPRLSRFRSRFPSIEVTLDASPRTVDLHAGEADVAIRFGSGRYPGLRTELLMRDVIYPVCNPALFGGTPPERTSDLLRYPLIQDLGATQGEPWTTWSPWLREAVVDGGAPPAHIKFGDATLALAAAIAGQGVMLARHSIASVALANGQLVRPIASMARESDFAYYVVATNAAFDTPRVSALRQWLHDECRESVRVMTSTFDQGNPRTFRRRSSGA